MYYDYYYQEKKSHGGLYNSKYEDLSHTTQDNENENDSPFNASVTNPAKTVLIAIPTKEESTKEEPPKDEPLYSDLSLAEALSPPATKKQPTKPTLALDAIKKTERKSLQHRSTDPSLPTMKTEHLLGHDTKSKSLQALPVLTPTAPGTQKSLRYGPGSPSGNTLARMIAQADTTTLKNILITRLKEGDSLDFISGNFSCSLKITLIDPIYSTEALEESQDKKLKAQNQGRKWNTEFQALLDGCADGGISMEEMRHFSELGYDFMRSAETYAK